MGVRVAALYDVHGNLPALEAVLREVDEEAVDVVVFGGDLVWGPWPSETLDRAESLGSRARFVRGNCETLVLNGASEPHAWARDRLRDEQRAAIDAWPLLLRLDVEGLGPALFCHATPRSDDEVVTPASALICWENALAGVGEQTVVCGHTHLQFDLELAGRRVVNPGSVGAPTRRAAAWWAVVGPEVDLRVTEYDTEATIAAARTRVPDVRPFADWFRETPSDSERIRNLEASA
jgi:predicted phosphodiesterase